MNRYISAILVPCLLLYFIGCRSSYMISKKEFILQEKSDVQLITKDGIEYNLESEQYTIDNDTVKIQNLIFDDRIEKVPLEDIEVINVGSYDPEKTGIMWLSIIVVALLFVVVIAVEFANSEQVPPPDAYKWVEREFY